MNPPEFEAFGKIPRFSREIVITEKIDGTNAQINIVKSPTGGYNIFPASRSRYLTEADDNYGFFSWVENNSEALLKLGEGRHYGEWWGSGIQRGYGLQKGEKRFSLFNTHRWRDPEVRPKCCDLVPVLYKGVISEEAIENSLRGLKNLGSEASPGFFNPEGIIIYHTAANCYFKKTLCKDEEPKGK